MRDGFPGQDLILIRGRVILDARTHLGVVLELCSGETEP